jgi:energy-converting hydrogenase B subunit L
MRGLISIAIRGSWKNLKRILFHSERVTSMEMRHRILSGQVKLPKTVNDPMCIGCGACARVCPTEAITMVDLKEPVKLTEKYTKKRRPILDLEKCCFCFRCHDRCPIFRRYNRPSAIHPREVGDYYEDVSKLLGGG